ncbi:class I SAM-dependent methyltransferase [Actinomadura kijaniata]|uniref:class I SAM-dependent methyltransferase n=1 Tax=Actinomadura kijaniata TaxID=46161 RepID=UPI000830A897|nr:class I SAM-dependent methyltransferase [Actinomadura kijaniata]
MTGDSATEGDDDVIAQRMADNQANWDARARVHADSEFYDLDRRPAHTRFHPREWQDLGPLGGRTVLHLQCHNGAETLAFAQRGAHATGLDFSAASLREARRNADGHGVDVEWVCADVHDALDALAGRTFDVVYTGRGALIWLPDTRRWAEVVAGLVSPGGLAYVMEFHPLLLSIGLDESAAPSIGEEGERLLRHDYLPGDRPITSDHPQTYAPSRSGRVVEGATVSHQWSHTPVEVMKALHDAGLNVDLGLCWETDWLNTRRWDEMVRAAPGWWRLPDHHLKLALMYGVGARRPAR